MHKHYNDIPDSVSQADVNKAIEPLLKLLNVEQAQVLADPGIVIGDAIEFSVIDDSERTFPVRVWVED